ncbi:MAG: BON domain-containing protein [Pseudomonas sp.]
MSPLAAVAATDDLASQLREARQEGSIWTAFALNRHLSPFRIDVDVENGRALLSGQVESAVERDLAEQVALGIDGIQSVDNQLKVDPQIQPQEGSDDLVQRLDDATLTATVKSKLLWNRHTEGLDIDVDSQDGVVTLSGQAQSALAKELAGKLAANTRGVRQVNNQLTVGGAPATAVGTGAAKAEQAVEKAGAVLSDAWISSKVKASFLYSRNLEGLNISVRTQDGVVSLSGVVASAAEKALAIETARNIRGVREVQAEALRVAG